MGVNIRTTNQVLRGSPNCLIIGGTGGIGRVLCLGLASKFSSLVIHGRSKKKLQLLKQEIINKTPANSIDLCPKITIIEQNFANRVDIHSFINKLTGLKQVINTVIINFGPILYGSIASLTAENYEFLYDMNVLLPSLVIRTLAPSMNSWGRIVLFGGPSSEPNKAYKTIAVYNAAKAALTSFLRSAAVEFASTGVRINLICPSYVATEYYDQSKIQELQDAGLLTQAKEILPLVDFLTSDSSEAVNGAIIQVGKRGFSEVP